MAVRGENKKIALLESRLAQKPTDLDAWFKLGELQLQNGNARAALRANEQAAIVAMKAGTPEYAIKALERAHQIDPQHIRTLRELARLYRRQDDLVQSTRFYKKMYGLASDSRQKEFQIEALEGLISLNDASVGTRLELAELLLGTSRSVEAVPHFYYVFEACRRQANIEDLVRVGERLIYIDRSQVEVMKTLARVYLGRKQPLRAQKKMELALKEVPHDIEVLELLATSFQELGDLYRARQLFRETLHHAEVEGRKETIVRVLEKIRLLGGTSVVLDAPNPQELERPGTFKGGLSKSRINERIQLLSQEGAPVDLGDSSWTARELEARAFIKIGLLQDAERELLKILDHHGDILSVWLWLGHVYEKTGRTDKVKLALEKLIQLGQQEDDPRVTTWKKQLTELLDHDGIADAPELGSKASLVFERSQVIAKQDQIQIPQEVLFNLERYRKDIPRDHISSKKPPPPLDEVASRETHVFATHTASAEPELIESSYIIRHSEARPALVADVEELISLAEMQPYDETVYPVLTRQETEGVAQTEAALKEGDIHQAEQTARGMLHQNPAHPKLKDTWSKVESQSWFLPDPSMPLTSLDTDLNILSVDSLTSPGQTHLELAQAYIEMGMYEDALVELDNLMHDAKYLIDADMMKAEVHLEMDAPKSALKSLIRLQKMELGRNDSIQMLKLLYRAQGRLGQLHMMQKTRQKLSAMGIKV